LEGATLLAAKELRTRKVIVAIFRIFMTKGIEPLGSSDDKFFLPSAPRVNRAKQEASPKLRFNLRLGAAAPA